MYDVVKDYYGKQLQSSSDLKTTACCDFTSIPSWLKPLLSNIHDEVLSRYYGCGLVCPTDLKGKRILDLGSGSGRDVYALAQLVGEAGHVVGVDMTEEQLAVANRHLEYHREKFGYAKSNVTFLQGYIERLDELGLEDNSFDVIVSNCVVNLSPDKDSVIREVYRLLKPGGEFYFSDVYSDRRIPPHVATDSVLYGECLGGAMYWYDFLRLSTGNGFTDPRLVEDRPLDITDERLSKLVGQTRFYSATYRLFKLEGLETACEDYGQAVIYKGSSENQPHAFLLDKHHLIETGKVFPVCGNTYKMLHDTRFKEHFDFIGDFSRHFGVFEGCGSVMPFDKNNGGNFAGGACC
ncbi:MAG: methyltransferase domain-containing protein [Burkholderiales bacterium]|jgi:arsenite methyltransferase|uniref:methyltransferase domain-containing protein n=1 Tax=Limnobacter sp. TaxID=2003368 RepID=UPI0039BC86F2|nr:methyltransferase domain-containing protein [Burkholderiales bacterium]